jgi:hypothetical protein
MEENSVPIVYSKHSYPCLIGYSPYTRRYSPNKHIIQAGKIGSLLPLIGRQDHETRGLGDPGPY